MSDDTATYVYCLGRGEQPPDLDGAPRGLPDAGAPRLLDLEGDLWLVVADVPLPQYGSGEIERRLEDLEWVSDRAVGHEAVVEHVHRGGRAVLPLKMLTLFAGDRRARAAMEERLEDLERVLDRLEDREEWGVRVRFDADAARARLSRGGTPASGRAFLERKRRVRDAARSGSEECLAAADDAYRALAGEAAEARRRQPADARALLLDAVFLVPRAEREAFETRVGEIAERLSALACELTLTGPWPPYNFVEEEVEG